MSIILGQHSTIFLNCSNIIEGNTLSGKFQDSIFDDVEISDCDIINLDMSHKQIHNLTIKNSKLHDVKLRYGIFNNINLDNNIISTSALNNSIFNDGRIRGLCLINTYANDLFFDFGFDILEIEYAVIKPSFVVNSKIPQLVNKNPHQCFHKDTYVTMKNRYKKMKNLRPGDVLDKNQVVKYVSRHKVNKHITMIRIPKYSLGKAHPIKELLVTPLHYIFLNGEYIKAYKAVGANNINVVKVFIDYLVNLTLHNKYESFMANGTFSISDGHENTEVDYFMNR